MLIFENKTFNTVKSVGDDCLHLNGTEAQIKNCVFSRRGYQGNESDELLGVINGSKVKVYNSLFEYNGKGVLIGTGDTNKEDYYKNQSVYFYRCIFDGISRRSPMVNSGNVVMEECIIKNWGIDDSFHTKSYGVRSCGKYSNLVMYRCIFEQQPLLACLSRINTYIDLINNLTWPPKGLGFMRGAWSDQGGSIKLEHCYKNRWWITLENSHDNMMEKEANELREIIYRELCL